jgi:hypothetical protein
MKTALYNEWVKIVADEKHVDDDPFISAMNSMKYGFNHWGCLVEAIIVLYPNSSGLSWLIDRNFVTKADEEYNLYIPLYHGNKECPKHYPPDFTLSMFAKELVDVDAFDKLFEESKLPFLQFLELPSTKEYLCLT